VIKRSNISEEDVIGSLVPVILLTIIVRARTRGLLPLLLEARLFALEYAVILQHLQLTLLSVFLLNLLDNVIVLEIFLRFRLLLESGLTNTKSRLLDDKVGIIFLFFDDFGGKVMVNEIVGTDRWTHSLLIYYLSINF